MNAPVRLPSLLALLLATAGCAAAPVAGYRVVHTFPHSTENYTEGFFYQDGRFYEGTGLNGHSALLITIPETGEVVKRVDLPRQLFGEGIAAIGTRLYEWTWQNHAGFIYDRTSLAPAGNFRFPGEGWGMTADDHELITSDGSDTLTFRDPATFGETRRITVHDGADRIDQLNELEYVHGEVFANVWHSDRIARISPVDGHVLGWIDCTGLLPDTQRVNEESVLNGIAYDQQHDRLFVTGKQWPTIFEIKVTEPHVEK